VRSIIARIALRCVSLIQLEAHETSYASFNLDVHEYERLIELANASEPDDSDSTHDDPPPAVKATKSGRSLKRSEKGASWDKAGRKKRAKPR
jgi:hypothetical protein